MNNKLIAIFVMAVVNFVFIFITCIKVNKLEQKIVDSSPVEESDVRELKARRDTILIIIDSLKHNQKVDIENAKVATDSDALNMWYKLLKS